MPESCAHQMPLLMLTSEACEVLLGNQACPAHPQPLAHVTILPAAPLALLRTGVDPALALTATEAVCGPSGLPGRELMLDPISKAATGCFMGHQYLEYSVPNFIKKKKLLGPGSSPKWVRVNLEKIFSGSEN